MLLLPESVLIILFVAWLAWVGRLVGVATAGLLRRPPQSRTVDPFTRADLRLLRSLHIRP